jgi:hypothetical protein
MRAPQVAWFHSAVWPVFIPALTALLKNRVRRVVHSSRALAISGLCCSLALRLF